MKTEFLSAKPKRMHYKNDFIFMHMFNTSDSQTAILIIKYISVFHGFPHICVIIQIMFFCDRN